MRKIKEVIVVEGKYDQIKLSQVVDAVFFCTGGFQIYHKDDVIDFLKKIAKSQGVILLTDSDRAGFRIRNYLKNKLAPYSVKHAFIPDIPGKEKRKTRPSKEGMLGVEGIDGTILLDALVKAGATFLDTGENQAGAGQPEKPLLTKADLYRCGLFGKENSRQKRNKLEKILQLPSRLSSNLLLEVLNTLIAADLLDKPFSELIKELES